MKLGIIDIGAGNIFSVIKAIKNLDFIPEIIYESKQITKYTHIVIPGVAAFETGSNFYLKTVLKRKYLDLSKIETNSRFVFRLPIING